MTGRAAQRDPAAQGFTPERAHPRPRSSARQSSRLVSGRLSVRSRPGAFHPLVAQHGRGIRLRTGPVVVRIHAGGLGVGERWFPHRPSFGAYTPCAWSASRPAKPASGVTARTTWQARTFPGQGRCIPSRRPPCRSLTRCDVVQWQDVRLLPGERWFDPSRRSAFLDRLTAGSSALNRRMRGSNPARGARSDGRGHGVQAVSNAAGEGSIPSVRARK
jgi:hypothetical protein